MISDQGGEDASDGGKCLTFLCVCVCALGKWRGRDEGGMMESNLIVSRAGNKMGRTNACGTEV